jgi:hypothetical protein
MVFTLVTIFFLPISFIATFFTININDFPYFPSADGRIQGLDLQYVAKYTFGIGLGFSIPLILIAFIMGDTEGWFWRFRNRLFRQKRLDKRAVQPRLDLDGESRSLALGPEKGIRLSMESWRYRHPVRADTGGTDRTRGTQELEAGSAV